jgi:uncharacterized protein (DUF302 family)
MGEPYTVKTFCAFSLENLITRKADPDGKMPGIECVGLSEPRSGEEVSMSGPGLVVVRSKYSVQETVDRLEAAFREKGMQIFVVIDHSGEAEKIGMKMPSTKVVIFGSPKGGTPLMLASPSLAIDLPLKALVAEDANGRVTVTYNDPEYLRERHGVPADLIKNLAGGGVLIAKAVE